jgi:hypothetical protein
LRSHKIRNNARNEEIEEGIMQDSSRQQERKRNEFAVKDEEIHRSEETRSFTVRERRGKETSLSRRLAETTRHSRQSEIDVHNIRMVGGVEG